MKILNIFLFCACCAFLASACSTSLFDELEVYSAREHLADKAKGGDLLQAMDKTGVSKVVLVGAYNNTFNPSEPLNPNSAIDNNHFLLDSLKRVPTRLLVFPLISGDEPNFSHYYQDLLKQGARGFTLVHGVEKQRRMSLTDPRLLPFYEWCEINHLPILIDIEPGKYEAEFEAVLRQYPHLSIIGGSFLHMVDDLPRLANYLRRNHNLYLDFSFGWDAEKKKAFESIAARRKEFHQFFIDYYDRILWGTQIIIARDAGRNVDWLTQYLNDSRYFMEKASAKLKFAAHGKSELLTLTGLDLDRRELTHIYNLNFKRLVEETAPTPEKFNLDKLLIGPPPKSAWDKNGPYRLILVCATGFSNAVDGIFSARLKNALTGSLTNWREINGIDQPIEIVTIAPYDQWLPKLYGLDRTVPIRVLPNAQSVRQYLVAHPMAMAFLAFADVAPGMRILSIDGENPTISYIRDCARRGGGLINNYFRNYPLLIPLRTEQPVPTELVFVPHRLTRVLLTDRLIPNSRPTGPAMESELDPYAESLFKLAPSLQAADFTVTALDLPLRESCASPGKDCLDAAWLNAFDYAGLDLAVLPPSPRISADDIKQMRALFQAHQMPIVLPDSAFDGAFASRGHAFDLLVVDSTQPEHLAAATARVAANAKNGVSSLVYLFAAPTDSQAMDAASRLNESGADAVVVTSRVPPQGLTVNERGFIAAGLGSLAVEPAEGATAFYASLNYYNGRLRNVDFIPFRMQGEKLTPLYGDDYQKAYRTLYPR